MSGKRVREANSKLGKIGMQEAMCLATVAACVSGIFTPDSGLLYARGNSAYISMLLSAAVALLVFLVVSWAMRISGAEGLWGLYRFGLGPFFGRMAAVLTALLLVFSTAMLFERFLLMLGRFVFPAVREWAILIYILLAVLLLTWLGFEGLGRTARLFMALFVLTLAGMLLLAVSSYEAHRLAPMLGDGAVHLFESGARDSALFLPALLSLMIAARGVHGVKPMRKIGGYTAALSGIIAALSQLCLGMTYTYKDLAQMHSPMYRLTMGFRTGGYFPKLDTLILFGWTMAGTLGASFYTYSAALLYMQAFGQEDIRPGLALFPVAAGALALIMHTSSTVMEAVAMFIKQYGFLLFSLPALLAALCALVRCRRNGAATTGRRSPQNHTANGKAAQPEVRHG